MGLPRARQRRPAQGVARPLPSPVGGWNAKDALDGMEPTDAVILENWFPRESDVTVRGGLTVHCNTGESDSIETLAEFKTATLRKLIAGVNGKLINATTSTPSTIGTGFTSDRWRWVNFGGHIFLVNGSDAAQDWDGTTLTATAWNGSGLSNSNLSDLCVFKERLWFVEKDTLNAWYAGLKSITGTVTKFPLQYTGSYGGTLKGISTLSIDGGDGAHDLILFYLSSGEVIVYSGSDPSDASAFTIVNRYFIAPLIAQGAVTQFGADVVALTQGAYTPISKVAAFGNARTKQLDLSDQISGAVGAATKAYKDNTGWQGIIYPLGRKAIFNVPRSATMFDQHVMNIDTRRWCKFTGWNFPVFGLFTDALYGGSTAGVVYKCDTGYSDNGGAIVADGQTAWNYFASPDRLKNFTMARVILSAVSDPQATMSFGTDFEISVPTSTVETADVDSGAIWDTAIWDDAIWAGATQTFRGWQGVNGEGYAASMRLRVSLTDQNVSWLAGQVVMKPGGMV